MSPRDRDPIFSPQQKWVVAGALVIFASSIAALITTEPFRWGTVATATGMVLIVLGQVSSARHVRRRRR